MATVLTDKDLDLALKSFQKVVENVASNDDEGHKAKVLKKLKDFNELINSPKNRVSSKGSKVPKARTVSSPAKKIKLHSSRKVKIPELPNEIWVKIMNYMPTKYIFNSLALVNKNSYQLTKDTKALKHFTIYRLSSHYSKANFEKAMKFLKKCTNLVGLTIDHCSTEDWQKIVTNASPNMKYLEILGDGTSDCNFKNCHIFHGDQLSIDVVKTMKKRKIKLENLTLNGTYVEIDVMDEISKIETLKSLRILDVTKRFVTPKAIESLAFNKNQLELIEIEKSKKEENHYSYDSDGSDDYNDDFDDDDDNDSSGLRKALNHLFEKKKDTLKIIRKINMDSSNCDDIDSCDSLENLSLCKNLVEFFGSLHEHELVHFAGLENLQKLNIEGLTYREDKYLKLALGSMNLSKLKHLSISSNACKEFCQELARHYFPALERLYIYSPEMTSKCFQQLIKNGPKLKSIQFGYGADCNISNKISHKLCKDTNVFVIFGNVIKNDENKEQKSFEDYLLENDLVVFRKYKKMKEEFEKWCEGNIGYGF